MFSLFWSGIRIKYVGIKNILVNYILLIYLKWQTPAN